MTDSAIAMMITLCTLVWGGFLMFLLIVWKIEKRKAAESVEHEPEKQNHI